MRKSSFETVDAYLGAQPALARSVLQRVRTAIHAATPEAEETIAYGMPAYKLTGVAKSAWVIYFAAWKEHYSLYPVSAALLDKLGAAGRYTVEKGTVRFPYAAPVPVQLIERIAKARAKEARVKLQ